MEVYDISPVASVRRRLGRAAFGLKIMGFLLCGVLAYDVLKSLSWQNKLALFIMLSYGVILLSRYLKAGNDLSIKVVILLSISYLILILYGAIHENKFVAAIIMLLFSAIPLYFIIRGLVTFYSFKKDYSECQTNSANLFLKLWRVDDNPEKHPAFANKLSLGLYLFLMLSPLPIILIVLILIIQDYSQGKSFFEGGLAEVSGRVIGASFFVLFIVARLYRRARRHALVPANELRKTQHRPLILFLRSFIDDKLKMRARAANGRSWVERFTKITFEEVLVDHFWRYGPVVAVGRPGEKLPPLGAPRDYLPDKTWQEQVETLMVEAALIVVVLGRTEKSKGLALEVSTIMKRGLTPRLIVVIPPIKEADLRLRWNSLVDLLENIDGAGSEINLPRDVDVNHLRAVVTLGADKVYGIAAKKGNDWSYEAALDACIEILDTQQHRFRVGEPAPIWNWIWPTITDTASAQKAARLGLWACAGLAGGLFIAILFGIFDIGSLDIEPLGMLFLAAYLLITIFIAWGIYRLNRFAPIAGLSLYTVVKGADLLLDPKLFGFFIALLVILLFINCTRGIFAFHAYHHKSLASEPFEANTNVHQRNIAIGMISCVIIIIAGFATYAWWQKTLAVTRGQMNSTKLGVSPAGPPGAKPLEVQPEGKLYTQPAARTPSDPKPTKPPRRRKVRRASNPKPSIPPAGTFVGPSHQNRRIF
jgi:hypothetical protein